MAVHGDFLYLRGLIREGVVDGPVLEIGSRAWQGDAGNARRECEAGGLTWEGTDLVRGEGVDFVLDILDPAMVSAVGRQWKTVLLFNLLEHVFNPIDALSNAVHLLAPGGTIVVVGPAIWQLHDYPRDYWRPMPDFFLEFAARHSMELPPEHLMWIVEGKTIPVANFSVGDQKKLPSISRPGVFEVWGKPVSYWSRATHVVLRTFGQVTRYPDTGLGVVLRKGSAG